MSDVFQKRRTGRKVAIDLEMAHFKKVRNFQMKSTAELLAGTRSGIENMKNILTREISYL